MGDTTRWQNRPEEKSRRYRIETSRVWPLIRVRGTVDVPPDSNALASIRRLDPQLLAPPKLLRMERVQA